jgi:hypothetical protein
LMRRRARPRRRVLQMQVGDAASAAGESTDGARKEGQPWRPDT